TLTRARIRPPGYRNPLTRFQPFGFRARARALTHAPVKIRLESYRGWDDGPTITGQCDRSMTPTKLPAPTSALTAAEHVIELAIELFESLIGTYRQSTTSH